MIELRTFLSTRILPALLAFFLAQGLASADGPAAEAKSALVGGVGRPMDAFAELGYSPGRMLQYGARVCSGQRADLNATPSSIENIINGMKTTADELSANLKRQILIDNAVGFASIFNSNRHLGNAQIEDAAAKMVGMGRKCDSSACDGVVSLLRQLADPGMPEADWCALFVATLATLADQEAKSGSRNVLHDGKGWSASEFASAYKLRADFDPKFEHGKHAKRLDAFLPAGRKPVPGCMAVYQGENGEGHMGLVIDVAGGGISGTMDTIEGNTCPKPGSTQRGAFLRRGRAWGDESYIEAVCGGTKKQEGTKKQRLYYKGCVLPWPDMAKLPIQSGCSAAVTSPDLKPWDFPGFTEKPGAPNLPVDAGGGDTMRFIKSMFQ